MRWGRVPFLPQGPAGSAGTTRCCNSHSLGLMSPHILLPWPEASLHFGEFLPKPPPTLGLPGFLLPPHAGVSRAQSWAPSPTHCLAHTFSCTAGSAVIPYHKPPPTANSPTRKPPALHTWQAQPLHHTHPCDAPCLGDWPHHLPQNPEVPASNFSPGTQ